MHIQGKRTLAIFTAAALGHVSTLAMAQATADTSANSAEEIVVTAQRRAESVQNIPIAIQALSSEKLEKAGVIQIGQLTATTPSFVYAKTGPQPTVTLRGLGAELYQIAGEPSITVSLDGVPLLRQNYLLGALFDVERVEVLRGPQGTIAGRNSTGGAINIITRRPNFNELEGGISATYGNFDTQNASVWVSGPVNEKVAAHFAAERRSQDGFVKSTINGQRYGGQDDVMARASVSARPADGVELTLAGDYFNSEDNSPAFVTVGISTPGVTTIIGPAGYVPSSFYDRDTRRATIFGLADGQKEQFTQRQYGVNFRGEFELGPVTTLRSVTGYRRLSGLQFYDSGRGDIPINTVHDNYRQKQFNQELSLTTSLGDTVDFLVGGAYIRESATEVTGLTYFEGLAGPAFSGPAALNLSLYDTIKLRSYAAFGQLEWRFAPTLQLTLGGRYTRDKKIWSGGLGFPIGAPLTPALTASPTSATFKSFTPRVALDWKPDNDLTVYASVSKGFKAGGFGTANGFSILTGASVDPFEPETAWSYEAGIKSALFDRTLTANLTGFWIDIKNLQYPFALVGGAKIANAGKARSRGIELELDYHPDKRLQLGFNATYLDAKYLEFITGDPSISPTSIFGVPVPGVEQGIPDQAGHRLTKAPKFSFVANASYRVPLSSGSSLTFYADYKYQSKIFFSPFENSYEAQKGYGLINGRITWEGLDDRLSISAFGRNLANKKYYVGHVSQGNNLAGIDPRLPADPGNPVAQVVATSLETAVVGEPRMYGVTVGYKF